MPNPSDIILDERLFAHIHLDHRLRGSHLQGNTFENTAGYILKSLQQISANDPNLQLHVGNIKNQFEKLMEYENEIANAKEIISKKYNESEVEIYCRSIEELQQACMVSAADKIIHDLNNPIGSGTVLIPGGWISDQAGVPGHAMVYQFIKQPDGSYHFIVYNTGEGIQYHAVDSVIKDKRNPIIAFHIPSPVDHVQFKQLILDLITPEIAPVLRTMTVKIGNYCDPDWGKNKIWNAKRIYEIFQNIPRKLNASRFENPVKAFGPEANFELFTQGQLSGTCSMRVLIPILRANMSYEVFQKFLYQLQLDSIVEFFTNQKQQKKLGNPSIRRQLLQAIRKLIIKTGKMEHRYKKDGSGLPIFESAETKFFFERLTEMQDEIKRHPLDNKMLSAKKPDRYDHTQTATAINDSSYTVNIEFFREDFEKQKFDNYSNSTELTFNELEFCSMAELDSGKKPEAAKLYLDNGPNNKIKYKLNVDGKILEGVFDIECDIDIREAFLYKDKWGHERKKYVEFLRGKNRRDRDESIREAVSKLGYPELEKYKNSYPPRFNLSHKRPNICITKTKYQEFKIYYTNSANYKLETYFITDNQANKELFDFLKKQNQFHSGIYFDNKEGTKVYKLIYNLVSSLGGVVTPAPYVSPNAFDESSLVLGNKSQSYLLKNRDEFHDPLSFLKDCYLRIQANNALGKTELIIIQIEKMFLNFPLKDKKTAEAYWQQLTKEQAGEALTYLHYLIRIYGQNCNKLNPYPSVIQTLTANTGLVMAEVILNQFFKNEPYANIYGGIMANELPRGELVTGIYAVGLDNSFDKRLNEFNQLTAEIHRETKPYAGDELSLYDIAFIKRHFPNKDVAFSRRDLNNALRYGLKHIDLSPEQKREYALYLQFKDFAKECGYFSKNKGADGATLIEFASVNMDVTNNKSENDGRLSLLSSRDKDRDGKPIPPYTIRFPGDNKDYTFTQQYEYGQTPGYYAPGRLHTAYAIQNPYILSYLFTEQTEDSNQLVVSSQMSFKDKEKVGELSRSLPFARHVKELYAVTVKDFFESELGLLNKDDYQKFLLVTLFAPESLEAQLKRNPNFVEDLKGFLIDALKYHCRDNQLSKGGIFVFELQYYLLKYLKQIAAVNSPPPQIINTIEWLDKQNDLILEQIESCRKEDKENKKVENDLLRIYFLKYSLSPVKPDNPEQLKKELKELLLALLRAKEPNYLLDLDLFRAGQYMKDIIQEKILALGDADREQFIKDVIREFVVPLIIPNDDAYSLCEIESLNFSSVVLKYNNIGVNIDFSTGKIETPFGRKAPIMPEIYNNQNFKNIFGHEIQEGIRQDINNKIIYRFHDHQGQSWRLIYGGGGRDGLSIQFNPPVENHWFEKVDSPAEYKWGDGKHHYYSARYCDTKQCLWWRECDALKPHLPSDYVMSVKDGYLLKVERNVDGSEICFELDAKTAQKTGYRLLPKTEKENAELYGVFSNFEDISHIEIYRGDHKQDPPMKIKLPRYGLEWELREKDGTLEYTWKQNPDYKLDLQHQEVIDGFPNMLYMVNEKNKETIAIAPRQDFIVAVKSSSGLSALFGSPEKFKDEYNPIQYEIAGGGIQEKYDIFSIKKREISGKTILVANTVEEYLQLAFLYLANREEENAILALREANKLGLHGTLEEVNLIKKIMIEIPKESDFTSDKVISNPETLAVKLFAASLLGKQQQVSLKKLNIPTHTQNTEPLKKISDFYYQDFANITRLLYQDYCKVQGNVPEHLQLDLNQRMSLLCQIALNTPALKNEKLLLDFISAKEERSYYLKKKRQLEAEGNNLSEANKQVLMNVNNVLEVINKNITELNNKITSLKNEKNRMDIIALFNTDFLESLDKDYQFIDMKHVLLSYNRSNMPNTSILDPADKPRDDGTEQNKFELLIDNFREAIKKINQSLTPLPGDDNEKKSFLDKQMKRNALEIARGQEKNTIVENRNKEYIKFLSQSFQQDLNNYLTKAILDEKIMKDMEDAIVAQANQLLLEDKRTFATATQERGEIKKSLQFGDLIFLYLQGDKKLFAEKTRIQDDNELNKIYLKIHQYLSKSTANLQNIRILKTLKGLEPDAEISVSKLNERPFSPIDDDERLIKLGDQLSATREYQISEHPEILLFEHYENMLLRAEQSETIASLLEKEGDGFKNKVVQLIMGFGKSKVLLPLMALKRADGTNLSMIEIPQSLFGPGFEDLSGKTLRLFGKKGFPLLFDRDANCSADNLKRLHDGLLDAVRNRDYVATTPESICSLQLKYLELLSKEESEEGLILTDEEKNQILYLEQILTLIKSRGDILIDECDTALAHNKELNYTIGQEPKPAPPYVMSHTLRIYDLLKHVTITPDKEPAFTLEDVMLGRNVIARDQDWEKALADLASLLMMHDEGTLNFVKSENREDVFNYLLNKSTTIPDCVKKFTSKERSLVDLVKGELGLFRLVLSKKPGVDYGFPEVDKSDYKGSRELAIPFFSNQNPNYRAKKSLYETMMLTIILQKRKVDKEKTLTPLLVDRFIEDFTTKAYKELADKAQVEDLQFSETAAFKKFAALTGLSLSNIQNDPNRYQKICKQNTAFNFIMQKYILSENKEHEKVLRSNRVNHIAQFRSASGISGTPWNVKAFHQRFEFDEKSSIGIDGITIAHLKRKKPKVDFLTNKDPDQIITQSVINNKNIERIHAFIDIGAIFEGQDNETIAKLLKEKLKDRKDKNKIKYILYFDNKNGLCALPLDGSPTIVIGNTDAKTIDEKTKSTPAERFTYYDQAHTTGIDIRQTPDTIGVTTLDLGTTARDCWQGVMRLRQLSGKQTVEFWLPEKLKGDKEWNVDDVIHFVQNNQIKKLAEIHLKAAIAKLDNIVREHFLSKIYTSADIYEKIDLRKRFANVFEITMQSEPSIKFSGIEAIEDTDKILKNHLQNVCLKKLDAMLVNDAEKEMLMRELNKVVENSLENCLAQSRYIAEAEKEIELELEKEREKEKEKEKEKEQEVEPYEPPIHSLPIKKWGNNFPTHLSADAEYPIKMFHLVEMLGVDLGFSKNIYVSENFRKSYLDQKNDMDNYIKPLNFFLVIKDASGLLKTLCITQPEAKEFMYHLSDKDILKNLKSQGVEAWVMTPHNTLLCGTSQTISDPNHAYPDLLAQLQYFNGDMDRLIRQQNFTWLLQENTLEKLDFLQNTILKNHQEKEQAFRYFINNINKIIAAKLQQVAHLSLDTQTPFVGIRDDNLEQGLKMVTHYLAQLDQLQDVNLKKTIINFTTVREDGKVFTPLDLAIKHNKPAIVQALKSSQALSISHNSSRSPILLALEYNRIDLLKDQILNDQTMYPPSNYKSAWDLLYDRMIASRKPEIIEPFLKMMKEKCDEKIINEIVSEKVNNLVYGKFSQSVMSTRIDYLLRLVNNPQDLYHVLFTKAQEEASPDNLIRLLQVLKVKGQDAFALFLQIKRPDVIMQILEDPQLQSMIGSLSLDNWSSLFNDAINPGCYLFLEMKTSYRDRHEIEKVTSRPLLSIYIKESDVRQSRFILSHGDQGIYSHNKIEEQPNFKNTFERYRNALKRGKQKVFLQNDNIILQFMKEQGHFIKPELLIFLLDKIDNLPANHANALIDKISVDVFPKIIEKIFELKGNNKFHQDQLALLKSCKAVPLDRREFWDKIFDKMDYLKLGIDRNNYMSQLIGDDFNIMLNTLVENYVFKVSQAGIQVNYYRDRLFKLIGDTLQPNNLGYYNQLAGLNFADPKLRELGNILLKTFVEYSCNHPEKLDIIEKLFASGLMVSYQDMANYINRLSQSHPESKIATWLSQQRIDGGTTYSQRTQAYEENIRVTILNMNSSIDPKNDWLLLFDNIIDSRNPAIIKPFLTKMKTECDKIILARIVFEKLDDLVTKDFSQQEFNIRLDYLIQLVDTPEKFYYLLFTRAQAVGSPDRLITILQILKDKNQDIHDLLLEIDRPEVLSQILREPSDTPILSSLTIDELISLLRQLINRDDKFNLEQIALVRDCKLVPLTKSEFWHSIFDKADKLKDKTDYEFNALLNVLTENYVKELPQSGSDLDYYRDRLLNLLNHTLQINNFSHYDILLNLNFADPKFYDLGNILLKIFIEYSCSHPEKFDIVQKLFANGLTVPYQDMSYYINKLSKAHPESDISRWLAQQKIDEGTTYALKNQADENEAKLIVDNIAKHIIDSKWDGNALRSFTRSTILVNDKPIKVPHTVAKQWQEIIQAPHRQTYLQALNNLRDIGKKAASEHKVLRSRASQDYYNLFLSENDHLFMEKFAKESSKAKGFKS